MQRREFALQRGFAFAEAEKVEVESHVLFAQGNAILSRVTSIEVILFFLVMPHVIGCGFS